MFDANFMERLFIRSIDHMITDSWEWPPEWDLQRKKIFLKHCLEYAEQRELYEQCAIIRDVEKELKETRDV
jgi:protein-arginine kinase activator protein McsA